MPSATRIPSGPQAAENFGGLTAHMAKVAINGFGRIGRNALRAYLEHPVKDLEIVAINDPLQNIETSAHLLKYDSILGELKHDVSHTAESLVINGKSIHFSAERDPANCPWSKHKIDIVLECSGVFTDAEKAKGHINAGAKKVLISAPAKNEDITIVIGVNDKILTIRTSITSSVTPAARPTAWHLWLRLSTTNSASSMA